MEIRYYQKNGELKNFEELSTKNLQGISGMLSKVFLKNGDIEVGYADPLRTSADKSQYDGTVRDYIFLWTFKNLDEENHKYNSEDGINIKKINIDDIEDVHSILYSNPRWGGNITNKFFIEEMSNYDG